MLEEDRLQGWSGHVCCPSGTPFSCNGGGSFQSKQQSSIVIISTKVQEQGKGQKVENLYGNTRTARLYILQPSAVGAARSSGVFANLSPCLAIVLKCRLAPKPYDYSRLAPTIASEQCSRNQPHCN